MKHLLIILISFLLLSSPLFGHPKGEHTLYRWETSSGHKWLGFGEKDTHPKYTGHVKDGKPNGFGFLIYPRVGGESGKKYIGEFKEGKLWDGKVYETRSTNPQMDFNGEILEKIVNGKEE